MRRFPQIVLIASFLPFCWLAMMVVHESGHMLAGYATGGQVTDVVLFPLSISRTDFSDNPHPLVVSWAGPIIGIVVPLIVHLTIKLQCSVFEPLARFFVGFCLVANGAYIGIGSIHRIGDAGDLLRLGAPHWLLWVFGLSSSAAGLWYWNGLGPAFGLGTAVGKVDARIACTSLGLLIAIIALELLINAVWK